MIRQLGDPVLETVCSEVTEPDDLLEAELTTALKLYMGLAVAANQIGSTKRAFVYDVYGSGPQMVYNPVLSELSGRWATTEGCLSIPGISFGVTRLRKATLTGKNRNWEDIHIKADLLLSRVFQHEVDHLEGLNYTRLLNKVQYKYYYNRYGKNTNKPS